MATSMILSANWHFQLGNACSCDNYVAANIRQLILECCVAAYLRLNIIDQYNYFMGFVDLADQLRNVYRPDHFSRKRKWWAAMFWWAFGVCLTNAYVIYVHVCARDQLRPHEILSHREFLELVAEGYMFAETVAPGAKDKTMHVASPCKPKSRSGKKRPTPRAAAAAAKKYKGPNTSPTVSNSTAHEFTSRFVNVGIHEVIPNEDASVSNAHRCVMCWLTEVPGQAPKENPIRKSSQMRCSHCNVYLCLRCWPIWHKCPGGA